MHVSPHLLLSALGVMGLLVAQPAAALVPTQVAGRRVVLGGVPNDLVPNASNIWKCSCDNDGCWPGCFTVATAVVLKYWANKGYSNAWDGSDDNGGLFKLREAFPNLLCYGNGNSNGKPGETGYDAYDVAGGLQRWMEPRGYNFKFTAIVDPSFEDLQREIDSGRPIIGAFGESPWGSHAGTVVGYDTTGGVKKMIVRANYANYPDIAMPWLGSGYRGFSMVTMEPLSARERLVDLPSLNFDFVVHNRDEAFERRGDWAFTLGYGLDGNALSIWTATTESADSDEDPAWVRWSPEIPHDGMWEVLAWMPSPETDSNLSDSARYRVLHAEGLRQVTVSQQDAVQGWRSLGQMPFKRGQRAEITLGNRTGEELPTRLWADAIKLAWRAPLLVRPDDQANQVFLVQNGRRHRVTEPDTLAALRMTDRQVRALPATLLSTYPLAEPVPSIYTGWVGQYFNNANLSAPAVQVRNDPRIDFLWTGRAPAPNMSELGYSVRWSRLLALSEGSYTFRIDAIGGLRLWVDGRLVLDAWQGTPDVLLRHEGTATIKTGLHRMDIEYVNRGGMAQIKLANLPPAVPVINDAVQVQYTRAPTATLSWSDAGDPDGISGGRRFYISVWRVGADYVLNSDWMQATAWTVPLVDEGRYLWRVGASDGESVSDYSVPREFWVDRTPPWAQMRAANTRGEGEYDPLTGNLIKPTNITQRGIALNWEGGDGPQGSGIASVDIQAREILRGAIESEVVTQTRELGRLKYELTLSGTRELTRPVVVTETVTFTTTDLVQTFTPVSGTWKTIGISLTGQNTIYIGTPGSAYEFRVRARDKVGNEQAWYDGYSVTGQMTLDSLLPLR